MGRNILILSTIYLDDMVREICEKRIADYCFCISPLKLILDKNSYISTHTDKVTAHAIEDIEIYESYDSLYNSNDAPALSKQLLEAMLPYESMAIKMGRRKEQYPPIEYEEEKRNYHKALRYLNYILKKYEINCICMDDVPHYRYSYILYGLAKIYHIRFLIITGSSIPGTLIYGTDIDNTGQYFKRFYEQLSPNTNYVLKGTVKEYYDKYTSPISQLVQERRATLYINKNRQAASVFFFAQHLGVNKFLHFYRRALGLLRMSIKLGTGLSWFNERRNYIRWLRKIDNHIRYYLNHEAMTIQQYDKIAEYPDYNKKYIYFALQLTPEQTIIPRAGVFGEQYTSIQLIARVAANFGIDVYVKEHYVQLNREREVYEIIKSIPNVRLIKTCVSSLELIEHCIAVSTQTGTCILEGALQGKPALVTSSGYCWKGLPSVFEIVDEEQGTHTLRYILTEYKWNRQDILRYFYAIQENSPYFYIPQGQMDREKYMKCLNDRVSVLKKYLNDELYIE